MIIKINVIFFPLYILASFVEDKVTIGSWIYLWAFYSGPLINISVFVPTPYCLDDCGFVKKSYTMTKWALSQECKDSLISSNQSM